MKVLIVGGGIGGLAAAIALAREQIEVEVIERATAIEEIGAGFSLWANATRALDALGLGDAVRAIGMPAVGGLWRRDGRVLAAPPLALQQRLREVCLVVHRAELQAVLMQALGAGSLTVGARVVGIDPHEHGVSVALADGSTRQGDVLIGADGLRSIVRTALHGDARPEYAGYTAWRGVAALAPEAVRSGETWGAGCRFGQVPLTRGRVYWFAAANAPEGERSSGGERATLLALFRGWHRPIETLIESTADAAILRNDIYDRPALAEWGRGRVTLLGDAAHPMTPNLGQGACQAIEDAVVLARSLRRTPDPVTALRAYERARRPRTDAIVRESRQIGRVAQYQHPVAVALRDFAVSLLPARLQSRRLEALIEYDATRHPA